MDFISRFIGFCGSYPAGDLLLRDSWRIGEPEAFAGETGATQWLHPVSAEEPSFHIPEGRLFLAGLVRLPGHSLQHLADTISTALMQEEYTKLAPVSENAAGCFLRNDGTIYLWVGFASKDWVFFRTNDFQIRWSTNPLDLVEEEAEIDLWALRRCCYGDDAYIYPTLNRVQQGQLLTIAPDRTITRYQFDRFTRDSILASRRTALHDFLIPTHQALCQAVQPLRGEKVGLLCSGGPGSAAILATLKETGIDTVAYHLESPDPSGSEFAFARLLCDALGIPLRRLTMDTNATYLSPDWIFPHPYAHAWGRWHEQAAIAARSDHISLLVTGGGDDSAFGPGLTYGFHSLLAARISWQEKVRMIRGLFSTDWNIFDILGSLVPTRQLVGPSSLAGIKKEDCDWKWKRADFLTPPPDQPRTWDDPALQHAPCFSPQAMALQQAILQPLGIRLYNPYHQRSVQSISLALPDAYKLIPNLFPELAPGERIIDKPVLRLAFANVPTQVMWRGWSVWTQAACQRFCLSQIETLRTLLGKDSHLAVLGIVNPSGLENVFCSRASVRENYKTLITSAAVELYLKNALQPHLKRNGRLSWIRNATN